MGPQNAGKIRYGILAAIGLVHAAAAYGLARIIERGFALGATWWLTALWYGVSGADIAWAVSLYAMAGIGITAGYHRLWTHRSFECTPTLERLLAAMGAQALEGDIRTWYKNHQQHHAFADKPGDPHSPVVDTLGWAHIGWLFQEVVSPPGYTQATFQDFNPVVRWQKRWFWPFALSGFVVPLLFTWSWTTLWLAGFIRVVLFWHVTWAVNSVCHTWGRGPRSRNGEPLPRRDWSTDNAIVAFLGFGEGWHATHHADPNSYDLGVWWWRWDPGRWFIDFWAYLGSVTRRNPYSR